MQLLAPQGSHSPDPVQRFSMVLMSVLVLLTFLSANMQALLWQSSDWLVSTVLPAVVIDLTNEERQDNAQPALVRNPKLDAAAAAKARHMAEFEYFSHFAPDGTTPWEFFADANYVFAHAGENLAIHFTDSSEVVEAWMQSPAHRKNIVDSDFTEIGVGTAKGTFEGYETVYVVQLFGAPAAARPAAPTPAPTSAPEPELIVQTTPVTELVPEPAAVATEEVVEPVEDLLTVSEVISEPEVLPTEVVFEEVPAEPADETPVELAAADTPDSDTLTQEVENEPAPVAEATDEPAEVTTEPTPAEEPEMRTTVVDDVVIVQSELATSSGLAVATLIENEVSHAGATIASIATRPNLVLQTLYVVVAALIVMSLAYSLVMEARRLHYLQVAYSIALLLVMGGLWFIHATLTGGAVIV